MQKAIEIIRKSLAATKDLMNDQDFHRYLDDHPDLHTLISAARREGNLSPQLLYTHIPKFKGEEKDALDLGLAVLAHYEAFAVWLASASSRLGFSVLDIHFGTTAQTLTSPERLHKLKSRYKRKRSRKPRRITSIQDLPSRSKSLRGFCRRVGGVKKARRIIAAIYADQKSQKRAAKTISEKYVLTVNQRILCSWMKVLSLTPKPQLGRRQIILKKDNFKADRILRVKKKISLVAFLRQARAKKKAWVTIANEISRITQVRVFSDSMIRLAKRVRIS
ncbi:MAG: hypothetical protein WCT08_04290 [Patescibacteria group bacterium]|jgi:hypothetical protein